MALINKTSSQMWRMIPMNIRVDARILHKCMSVQECGEWCRSLWRTDPPKIQERTWEPSWAITVVAILNGEWCGDACVLHGLWSPIASFSKMIVIASMGSKFIPRTREETLYLPSFFSCKTTLAIFQCSRVNQAYYYLWNKLSTKEQGWFKRKGRQLSVWYPFPLPCTSWIDVLNHKVDGKSMKNPASNRMHDMMLPYTKPRLHD